MRISRRSRPSAYKALFAKAPELDALPVNELMAALVTNGSAA